MSNLAARIEQELSPLIGLRLSATHRAGPMRMFDFGELRTIGSRLRGSDSVRRVGQFALHIQCPWRIEGPEGFVTGLSDLWQPIDPGPNFDVNEWDPTEDADPANLQDRTIDALLEGR